MEKTTMPNHKRLSVLLAGTALCAIAACTPTVQIQAPDKPIEINLNVNIEHHVKVEIQRDVRKAMAKNKDIF
jgi:hypothetical protein